MSNPRAGPGKALPRMSGRRAHAGRNASITGPARSVLVLVIAFTIAFVSVIGMKIVQERRDLVFDAEIDQAHAAAFVAERVGARLARAQGAIQGAAQGMEADWARDETADLERHIAALVSRGDTISAALVTPEGRVSVAPDPVAGEALAAAFALRGERAAIWTAPSPDGGGPGVYIAAELALGGAPRVLVGRIDPTALVIAVPGGQRMALADGAGRTIVAGDGLDGLRPGASAPAFFGIEPAVAARSADSSGGAVRGARVDGVGEDGVLGVAPVARTGLMVNLAGPLELNQSAWRRAVIFYALLLAAPLLVAVGLCTILILQLGSIRRARRQLADSERLYRLAIESARCGVWDWDLTNDTVFVSDSFAAMLGRREAGTLTGSELISLVRKEDQERLRAAIRGAANQNEVDVEFRAHKLPVWLHARGRPWTGPDGQPSGRVVGVAIDTTEQKGAQARVNAAESRLRAALESMSESFVLWDARDRLVLSNSKFRDFFNLDTELVKPSATYEMLELAAQGAIKNVFERPDIGASELELVDGRWIHLSERRTADRGLVSIGTDITALKHQEAQLIDNEKRLRKTIADYRKAREHAAEAARHLEEEKIRADEANRSKSEFLANMSHELRTPLNAIIGFSEMIESEVYGPVGSDKYLEYAADILSSGHHLRDLINEILDMSKIEAGKRQLQIEVVDPAKVVQDCARLMTPKAQEEGLDLKLSVAGLPEIDADPMALKQILLNLISNAIKFTPSGGKVEIRGKAGVDGLAFAVTDTGIGIAEADIGRLGRPFEQIENHHSRSHQGTGLGLALSKKLVEMHGGALDIHSVLGKGTTVSFTIPYERPGKGDAGARAQSATAEPELA